MSRAYVAAIFAMTSSYIHTSSAQPMQALSKRPNMRKFLFKALPLVLLFVSAAIHACCACPMAFHDEEGPGPAERAIFGAAKRKRPRIMARITRTVNELIFSRVKCALERAEVIFLRLPI